MKKIQGILAGLATVAIASSAYAYQPETTMYAAGSSAQFSVWAVAALQPNAFCGSNIWTSGSNAVTLVDPRSSSIVAEPGNIWVTWNSQAAAGQSGGFICYYVSVDSIVGVRTYQAGATLNIPAALAGTADNGKLNAAVITAAGGTISALPAAIQAAINGTKLNVGVTDVRPEDAKFASNRALTGYGSFMTGRFFTGLGYNSTTTGIGTPIQSSQSTTVANPVDFALYWQGGDKDPFTGNVAREGFGLDVGGAPVVVFINTSNTAKGHLGDGTFTNVNHFNLANILDGGPAASHTSTLSTVSGYAGSDDFPLHTFIREPISGTYNTTDFNVGNTLNIGGDYAQAATKVTGQESNISFPYSTAGAGIQPIACSSALTGTTGPGYKKAFNAPTESGNPFFHMYANNGTRARVIGTGEMIQAVQACPDSIGYAFWAWSSFSGKSAAGATQIKYLTVDGVDPLYSSANPNPNGQGIFPTASGSTLIVPLDNIKNGSYPIWTKYRAIYDPTDTTNVATNVVAQIPVAATYIADLVPALTTTGAYDLQVFRSHSGQVVTTSGVGEGPNNGYYNGIPETGGDMGGAVLTINSELDYISDTGGNTQVNLKN